MATSSITHNFVISDEKSAKAFVDIIDSPVLSRDNSTTFRIVRDQDDISSTVDKLRKKYCGH